MTCRKGNGLIKEKQLRPIAPRHDLALAVLPIEHTTNPRLMGPASRPQNAAFTVQNPAVASESASACIGDDLSRWQHAVLERHTIISFVDDSVTSG